MGGWTQRILCNYLFCSIYTRLSTVNRIYFPINYILRRWSASSLAHYIIAKGNFCGAKRYGSKRQPIWFMTNKSSLYFVVCTCVRKANKSAINLLNIHMMKCANPNKLSHNLFTVFTMNFVTKTDLFVDHRIKKCKVMKLNRTKR